MPLLAALTTVVLWASAFVALRDVAATLQPGPLALGRLAVATLVLGCLVAARREPLPARRDVPLLLVCGGLWFGAYNVLLNAGEHRVDAGTASMLVNLGPVLIAVLGGLLLAEGFPPRVLGGCALGLAGAATIGLADSGGARIGGGALLCLAAACAYAGGVVAQKPLLGRLSPLQVTFAACAIGCLLTLPFAPGLVHAVRTAPARDLAWAAYLGVFPTALAFTTWAYALARTSAGRMAATTYLVPPLATLIGWLWLGEVPAAGAFAGGALALLGVAVARGTVRARRRRAPAPAR